jgi:glyoxylase-like metal-dependent hydrolase (beta-lactamase superfamily II)
MELAGKRVAFTGDIGFENQDILHRCWGDAGRARAVTEVVREKLLPFRPDVVFTGHDAHRNGTAFIEDLVRRSEESIRKAGAR